MINTRTRCPGSKHGRPSPSTTIQCAANVPGTFAGDRGGIVSVWDLAAGTPVTRSEWRQYVPGARYRPPCAAD